MMFFLPRPISLPSLCEKFCDTLLLLPSLVTVVDSFFPLFLLHPINSECGQ